ncbi:MAG: BrnT family toxin [Gammaproteobacteria bacterium]|nr:BrnT family toxin [Gammaproteobacteria bacterium]
MLISYDPRKRRRTLEERGLDFDDAAIVFSGVTFELADLRREYGEHRRICYGHLADRMVVIGYVQRGDTRHVFSMRKANAREKTRLSALLEVGPAQV